MLTENNVNDVFQQKLQRVATPFEYGQYKNKSVQELAMIDKTYGSYNKDGSIVDYLKYTGVDPSMQNRQQLAQQHGISGYGGSAEANNSLLKALRSGSTPQQPSFSASQGTVPGAAQTSAASTNTLPQNINENTQSDPQNNSQNNSSQTYSPQNSPQNSPPSDSQILTPQVSSSSATYSSDPALATSLTAYQGVQKQIQDIDTALANELQAKKDQVIKSGGIVNEAQLMGLVQAEKAPLITQRNTLVGQQSTAGKQYQALLSADKVARADAQKRQQENDKVAYENAQLQQKGSIATAANALRNDQLNTKKSEFTQTEKDKQRQYDFNVEKFGKTEADKMVVFNEKKREFNVKLQSQKDLIKLKAELSGTNQTVSPELAQAISEGKMDVPTSRNIKAYNDLAKMGINVVKSKISMAERKQVALQAAKYQTSAIQMAGVLEANMPTLIDLAGKVNTSVDSRAINEAFIKGKAYSSSDPDIAAYMTALINARTEYANLVSRGGQATEQTRAEAVEAIPAGYTPAQYQAVLDTEIKNAQNTYDISSKVIDNANSNRTESTTQIKKGNKADSVASYERAFPDKKGTVDKLVNENPNMSEEEVLQILQPDFSTVGADTNTGSSVGSKPDGSKGGQCGVYAQKLVNCGKVGDTTQTKQKAVDQRGVKAKEWKKNPQVGDALIFNYNHIAVVNSVNDDGTVTLSESNYKKDETVTNNRRVPLSDPSIYGALR